MVTPSSAIASGAITDRDAPSVIASGVSRQFGAIQALKGVNVALHPGEVHALVGENGAGKSTLLGILAGRLAQSSGEITAFGQPMSGGSPRESRARGIVAIYQELTMLPARRAFENVFLGQLPARAGLVDFHAMRRRFRELCEELDVHIGAGTRTDQLSVANQQLLEVMRALQSGAQVLLFDEPTASLGPRERDRLLDLMVRLKTAGKTIAFVSHNLDEVLEVSDRVTVFRDGLVVASGRASDFTKAQLVHDMLGTAFEDKLQQRPDRPGTPPRPLLSLRSIAVPGLLYPIDLDIRAGEVLGIAGLVGAGRTSLLRAIAGLERAQGQMEIDGRTQPVPRTPRAARALGIALLPEDRKGQGLVLGQSSATNVVLGDMRSVARNGLLGERDKVRAATKAVASTNFDLRRLGYPARGLSGGNQQKLMLGRWRHATPRVLLADEPTRGIDIGAKTEILSELRRRALDEGLAVVIVSSELEEVLAISDRIAVMREGRLIAELDCHERRLTPQDLLNAAFGVETAQSAPDAD